MKKILNIVSSVLLTIFLVFSITLTILVLTSTKSDLRVPSIGGYALMTVQTDSMEGENGFNVGDMILIRLVDEKEAGDLHVGDVITFWRNYDGNKFLETHRIVENKEEQAMKSEIVDGILVHGGTKNYVTKGDNTPGIDMMKTGDIEYKQAGSIVGLWEGKRIPKLGSAIDFLKSQTGFFCCIVLPLLVFFLYELYQFISTLSAKKKKEALEAVAESENAIKQKAIEEYLAQQQQKQEENTNGNE